MKQITDFLIKNGFEQVDERTNYFKKGDVIVWVYTTMLTVWKGKELTRSPVGSHFYWLIGYLTYNGIIDKNYKI